MLMRLVFLDVQSVRDGDCVGTVFGVGAKEGLAELTAIFGEKTR